MMRRTGLGVCAMVIAFGSVVAATVGSGVAGARPPSRQGFLTGDVTCGISGIAKITPSLSNTPAPGSAASFFSFTGKTIPGSCVGSGAVVCGHPCAGYELDVSLLRAKVSWGGPLPVDQDCGGFAAEPLPEIGVTVDWKPVKLSSSTFARSERASIFETHIDFTAGGSLTVGNPIVMNLPGAAIVQGGFLGGEGVTAAFVADQTATDFADACASKGLRKLTFKNPSAGSNISFDS